MSIIENSFVYCLLYRSLDIMDLLSNIDESQWKNDEPKNIQGTYTLKQLTSSADWKDWK